MHQTPKIPNYTIISPLGAGTSGHVWLAKDRFGERRAIKVTHLNNINLPDYQRRFIREVNAQRMLYQVSSHVARIFDYDEKHVPPYIVMDYINGVDLNQLLTTREMKQYALLTRLHWIEAIASTLTKAHSIRIAGDSHGIIHRDIKPQNIRIQGERPYLLDFSISLTSDVEIDNTQDAMTLRYAAPEMRASAVADIFSFGLVAYEILYEAHPITTHTEAVSLGYNGYHQHVLEKLEMGTWQFPSLTQSNLPALNQSDIQRDLDRIFQKVLASKPYDRYQSPKDFSDDLISAVLRNQSTPSYREFSSTLTTETLAVSVKFDDIAQQIELDDLSNDKSPQSTRRFTKAELQNPVLPRIEPEPAPLSSQNDKSLKTLDEIIDDEDENELEQSILSFNHQSNRKINYTVSLIAIILLTIFVYMVFMSGNNNSSNNLVENLSTLDSNALLDSDLEPTAVSSDSVMIIANSLLTRTATSTSTASPTASATSTSTLIPSPVAWQIEEQILSYGEIRVSIATMYIPKGCTTTSDNEELCIEEGLWIDVNPVSNSKYDLCSRIGDCSRPAYGSLFDPAGAGAENPVVGVNFMMAQRYCEFRDAIIPNVTEWKILVDALPEAYQNKNEWVLNMKQPIGQSTIITLVDNVFSEIELENDYLNNDLTFRCVSRS